MSGPDPGAFGAIDAGPVPAVAGFEVADSAFAAGAPFDVATERFSMLLGAPRRRRFVFARNHHAIDTEVSELLVDLGLAIAAVGGDRTRRAPDAFSDSLHRRRQLRRVGRVAHLDVVIDDDAVVVVDDLARVAELNRLTETTLGDRARIAVMQNDPPGRPVGGVSRDALASLFDD